LIVLVYPQPAGLFYKKSNNPLHGRKQLIINKILENGFGGFINTSKYARLAKCSKDTALRDIFELKELGILVQNPGDGRSTSYKLTDREKR